MEANRQKSDIIGPNLFNRKRMIILNSEKKNLKLTSDDFLFHSEILTKSYRQRPLTLKVLRSRQKAGFGLTRLKQGYARFE